MELETEEKFVMSGRLISFIRGRGFNLSRIDCMASIRYFLTEREAVSASFSQVRRKVSLGRLSVRSPCGYAENKFIPSLRI